MYRWWIYDFSFKINGEPKFIIFASFRVGPGPFVRGDAYSLLTHAYLLSIKHVGQVLTRSFAVLPRGFPFEAGLGWTWKEQSIYFNIGKL